jgi:protein-S-isoprenylcysteine O-methyltransferase Ste14
MKSAVDSPQVMTLPPLIFLSSVVVGFVVDWFMPAPFVTEAHDLPAGLTLIAVSLALIVWSARTFVKAGTNVDPREPSLKIVDTGPFAFSRNPMYLGMTLATVGFAIWLNSLWILAALAVALVFIQDGVIAREEAYLEKKFGKQYLDYKTRVRRWL